MDLNSRSCFLGVNLTENNLTVSSTVFDSIVGIAAWNAGLHEPLTKTITDVVTMTIMRDH
jgi:hypothetical protein